MKRTYSPVALVIDDEQPVIQRLQDGFLKDTALGVLVAEDLVTAGNYLEDPTIKIDAVVTDLNFPIRFRDKRRNLANGLDLLELSKIHRPNVPKYIYSVDAEDDSVRRNCEEQDLAVEGYFPKLGENSKPWVEVERACLSKRLKKSREFRQEMEQQGVQVRDLVGENDIVDTVRTRINLPRLTYLRDLGPKFTVIKPIEVLCVKDEDDCFRASALQIGLITDGEGPTTERALESLAELICAEMELCQREGSQLVGYAAHVCEMLSQFVELLPSSTART